MRTNYYHHSFNTFKPNRLVWKGHEAPKAPEAAKPQTETIQQIYEALVKERSGLEGKRGDLGAKMWQKLEDQPQLFSPELLKQIASSPR
jgi:hypothetical protein